MNDQEKLSEELISAFLDDQLNDQERDRVERLLAESGEHRRALQELREVRESLQSLPRHRLPEDFGERVLRRAERAMLTEQPDAAQAEDDQIGVSPPAAPRGAEDKDEDEVEPAVNRDRGIWRGVAWGAIVVAAAIMLMVFVPEQRQVGLVDKNRVDHEAPSAAEADVLQSADSQTTGGEAESPLGKSLPQAPALADNLTAAPSAMSDAVLIVRLDVTPAALADRAFERSLASHQIPIITPTGSESRQSPRALTDLPSESAENEKPSRREALRADVGTKASQESQIAAIYVEAPADQIDAMLTELRSQTAEFPSIVSDSGNDEHLQQLVREIDVLQDLPAQFDLNRAREADRDWTVRNLGKRGARGRLQFQSRPRNDALDLADQEEAPNARSENRQGKVGQVKPSAATQPGAKGDAQWKKQLPALSAPSEGFASQAQRIDVSQQVLEELYDAAGRSAKELKQKSPAIKEPSPAYESATSDRPPVAAKDRSSPPTNLGRKRRQSAIPQRVLFLLRTVDPKSGSSAEQAPRQP